MMFHALRECHQEAKSALIIHNHVRNHSVYCGFKFRILLMDHCTIKVLHLWKNAHAFRMTTLHAFIAQHREDRFNRQSVGIKIPCRPEPDSLREISMILSSRSAQP